MYVVLAYDNSGDIVKLVGIYDKGNYGEVYRELLEDENVSFCELEKMEIYDG